MKKTYEALTGKKILPIILDTDAYNEIDDQYAIAYAMLSPEKVRVLAMTAAPFFNPRSTSPGDGMEKSYHEILRIRSLVDPKADFPVYRGSCSYLQSKTCAVESEAADAIVRLVTESPEPVCIIAIGAVTNVASAIIKCPDITKNAMLIWLGGNALHVPSNHEFNLMQDVKSAQVIFDSDIPLVQIPCEGVCTEFATTIPELSYYLEGKNPLCDYLLQLTRAYNHDDRPAWSKVIWDVTAVAAAVFPRALDMYEIPRPIITDNEYYASDMRRPRYLYVRKIRRDVLFADLFKKLAGAGSGGQ